MRRAAALVLVFAAGMWPKPMPRPVVEGLAPCKAAKRVMFDDERPAFKPNLKVKTRVRKSAERLARAQQRWDARMTREAIRRACGQMGLDERDTAYLVSVGEVVAYRESRHDPSARNGRYIGLFQLGPGWGPERLRLDPYYSAARFVRAYVLGGRRNLYRHWAQTMPRR